MLGSRLRKSRKAAGMTQEQVADKAGVSSIYVSMVENDRRGVTVAVLLRLCNAMGVKASQMIAEIERSE